MVMMEQSGVKHYLEYERERWQKELEHLRNTLMTPNRRTTVDESTKIAAIERLIEDIDNKLEAIKL